MSSGASHKVSRAPWLRCHWRAWQSSITSLYQDCLGVSWGWKETRLASLWMGQTFWCDCGWEDTRPTLNWTQINLAFKHEKVAKHDKVMLTGIKKPAKLPCCMDIVWLGACLFRLSRQFYLLAIFFCLSSFTKFGPGCPGQSVWSWNKD